MRTALGVGLLWGAYTIGLYGYVLLKSYDLTFLRLVDPRVGWTSASIAYNGSGGHAPNGAPLPTHPHITPGQTMDFWPPPSALNTVVFPNGQSGANGSQNGQGAN